MASLKLIILSVIVVFIAMLAFSIPLMLGKKNKSRRISCNISSKEPNEKDISCGCRHSNSCIAE